MGNANRRRCVCDELSPSEVWIYPRFVDEESSMSSYSGTMLPVLWTDRLAGIFGRVQRPQTQFQVYFFGSQRLHEGFMSPRSSTPRVSSNAIASGDAVAVAVAIAIAIAILHEFSGTAESA